MRQTGIMDPCVRTSHLLVICAVLWLGLAAVDDIIQIKALQDEEVKAAVGTMVNLSCRFHYEGRPGEYLIGKFYTPLQGKNNGTARIPSCQPDGRLMSCELVSSVKIGLSSSSSKFFCEVTIPRPDGLVNVSGSGTTVSLYAEPASTSIQPQDLEEGKVAELRCEAHRFYPADVTVRWLCGERPARPGDVRNKFPAEADGLSSLYSWYNFTPTAGDNEMSCICKLHNRLWTRESEAQVVLNVSYSPRAVHMTADPGHVTNGTLQLAEGSVLNVTCAASGRPCPDIQWFWENMTRISSGGNLLIPSTMKEHEGLYWCVVKNQYGQSNASMVLLVCPRKISTRSVALCILVAVIVTLLFIFFCLTIRRRTRPNRGPFAKSVSDGAGTTIQGPDGAPCTARADRGRTRLSLQDGESEVLYAAVGLAASGQPKAAPADVADPSRSVVIYSEIAPRKERQLHSGGQQEGLHSTYILAEWPAPCRSPASAPSSSTSSPSCVLPEGRPPQPRSLT